MKKIGLHIPIDKFLKEQQGEGLVYETQWSCLTYSQSPNLRGIKGIGLHSHSSCDDIEILLEGTAVCFQTQTKGFKIEAPMVIVNEPSVPHSMVNISENYVLILGYRSPKSYQADILNIHEVKDTKQRFYDLNFKDYGSFPVFKTQLNCAYYHCFKEKTVLEKRGSEERTLINLCSDPIQILFGNTKYVLTKYEPFVCSEDRSLTTESSNEKKYMLLELIPTHAQG